MSKNKQHHHFHCNHCKKPYKTFTDAYSCSCNKKIKWANPNDTRNTLRQRIMDKLKGMFKTKSIQGGV